MSCILLWLMFTYCFNNEFICIFLILFVFYIFMTTNAAKWISRFGTIKFYCIVYIAHNLTYQSHDSYSLLSNFAPFKQLTVVHTHTYVYSDSCFVQGFPCCYPQYLIDIIPRTLCCPVKSVNSCVVFSTNIACVWNSLTDFACWLAVDVFVVWRNPLNDCGCVCSPKEPPPWLWMCL